MTHTTPLSVSIIASIGALAMLGVVFELIRRRHLRERYSLIWLLTGVVLGLLRRAALLRAGHAAALLDRDLAPVRSERDVGPEAGAIGRGAAAPERTGRRERKVEVSRPDGFDPVQALAAE
jgi:lysylphosphatidylglycerol synthetase-like protein (DUF2156 family)